MKKSALISAARPPYCRRTGYALAINIVLYALIH